MSQVTKKIKLDIDVSMDPFDEEVLPFDVHEFILQYLNGSDLLKASEMSRRWNQKVENAKGFLEKIKLTIASIPPPEGIVTRSLSRTKNGLSKDDIAAVLNSERHYINVEIEFLLLESAALRQELLQKFAASIKYMACDQYIDLEIPDVTFPKLTQLEMTDTNWSRFRTFRILLPLMPAAAVETLRVDTFTREDRFVIRCNSKSLKEVRYKSLVNWVWALFFLDPSIQPVNNNIRFIKE